MPGYSCSIKERMLYSSCKNHLVDWVEGELKLPIAKKVLAEIKDHALRGTELGRSSKELP